MSTINASENEKILSRLLQALKVKGANVTRVAENTGYSKGQVSWILSGKVPLNERFLKATCAVFSISEQWVLSGKGGMERQIMVCEPATPYIAKVVAMMEEMDETTQAGILHSVEKEKLLMDLLQQKQIKKAG